MVLSAKKLCEEIRKGNNCDPDGIAVVPSPDFPKIDKSGEASVELRLGRWFLTLRQSSETHLDAIYTKDFRENKFSKTFFVPFGGAFVVHPGRFVLASTLEWIRLPNKYAAYVVGKSTLRPREKLLLRGPTSLSDAELLAVFLRTGGHGKTAVDLARELLQHFGGLTPLLDTCRADLSR